MITIDFETMPIQPLRPQYPPAPVGVGIKWRGQRGRYFRGNEAQQELARAYGSEQPLLFHNAAFDLSVARTHCGLQLPSWRRVHDTMVMSFLDDPYGKTGLKDLTARKLGMANEDVSEMHGWILEHKAQLEQAYPQYGKIYKSTLGAWIFAVPEEIREKYALMDLERTEPLFDYLAPRIEAWGMWEAYQREMRLMPILLDHEQRGMCVDLERLDGDVTGYGNVLAYVDDCIRSWVQAPDLNLDSNDDLIQALLRVGELTESDLGRTKPSRRHPNGQISANKENLRPERFKTPGIASALGYRNRLSTCLNTFMGPWLSQAKNWNGRISTHWHQTRADAGGMKTGRIGSSEHNFLNLPKSFLGRDDGYVHPEFLNVPPLPLCREYIKPYPGHKFLHRDFDGQELRMFGHFENGDLLNKYRENPKIDVHQYIKEQCDRLSGRDLERTKVKIMNFRTLYGSGIPGIMDGLRCTRAQATEFKALHNKAMPGRVILDEEIKRIAKRGDKIRTWGGRVYGPPPKGEDGRDKLYVLINYLVQGSSADLTKQSLIDWDNERHKDSQLLVTVYDEINISSPVELVESEMAVLKSAMERPRTQVQMLSKGKIGDTWGKLVSTGNNGYD